MDDYIGCGLGASGFVDGTRYRNTPDLEEYISYSRILFDDEKCEVGGMAPYEEVHRNTPFDNISEAVFTGLRRAEGITYEEALRAYGSNEIGEDASKKFWQIFAGSLEEAGSFAQRGLLVIDDTGLRLTESGIDISNGIMALFV